MTVEQCPVKEGWNLSKQDSPILSFGRHRFLLVIFHGDYDEEYTESPAISLHREVQIYLDELLPNSPLKGIAGL